MALKAHSDNAGTAISVIVGLNAQPITESVTVHDSTKNEKFSGAVIENLPIDERSVAVTKASEHWVLALIAVTNAVAKAEGP